jgi:hypothetical protein
VVLRVEPAHSRAAHTALADERPEAPLAAAHFPTVSGPCDPSDLAAERDVIEQRAAAYLHDAESHGVGLAVGSHDRTDALATRAGELGAACECPDDDGCGTCVRNPREVGSARRYRRPTDFSNVVAIELHDISIFNC